MRSLRVAMIIQRYLPFTGGAEHQLAAVVCRLPQYGIEPCVITRRYDESLMSEVIDGVQVWRIPTPPTRVMASAGFTAGALRRLRSFRPDVVHAHELLSPTTTALAWKAISPTPIIAKILRGGEIGDIGMLSRNTLGRLRLTAIQRHVDVFAVISSEIDLELARLNVPAGRRLFLPNGVNVDRFKPATPAEKQKIRSGLGLPDGPIAVFAGRLEPEKRVDRLADLWPRIRASVPGAILIIAGSGALAARLCGRELDGVLPVGKQADMAPWYRAADAFILPSAAEGLSNALLEAMASGLVCVATAVGGAVDLLGTGEAGLLARPGDDLHLEELTIRALLGDGTASLAAAARWIVETNYSLDATVARMASSYRSMTRLETLSGCSTG
ncbi:MAG: glycosyltransferase family 4 protein [Candidatus Kaistia colombiensis]|nr:MAG: glycosyltransferase family 4 protein [Kaistia sp.]